MEPNTPRVLEIPKLANIEEALKDIKLQITNCAALYSQQVTPAVTPRKSKAQQKPVERLDLETSRIASSLNSSRVTPRRRRQSKTEKYYSCASMTDLDVFED